MALLFLPTCLTSVSFSFTLDFLFHSRCFPFVNVEADADRRACKAQGAELHANRPTSPERLLQGGRAHCTVLDLRAVAWVLEMGSARRFLTEL